MNNNIYFETERLYVVLPSAENYEYLYDIQSNPQTMRFFGGVRDRDTVKKIMHLRLNHYAKHNVGYGIVFQKTSNIFIGMAGLNKLEFNDDAPETEIGVLLLPQFWHNGFGTELFSKLIHYGMNDLGLTDVYATVDPENIYSKRALEAIGMKFQKPITYMDNPSLLFTKSKVS